jgi:hypothetical protein
MTAPKNHKFKDYARYAEHCLNMTAATTDQELRRVQREMALEWLNWQIQFGALAVGSSKCKWDDAGRLTWRSLVRHARKGFRWSTGRSDTRSALGSSETNGPCPFIPQVSKAREDSSPGPVCERSC